MECMLKFLEPNCNESFVSLNIEERQFGHLVSVISTLVSHSRMQDE